MNVPLTVSFKNVDVDEVIRTACWTEAEKLERYYDRITSCHVTVTRGARRQKGNHFEIHVRLALPGGEVVVTHAPAERHSDEKPGLAVRDAFDEVRRQLQDHVRRLRGDVKTHARPAGAPPDGTGQGAG